MGRALCRAVRNPGVVTTSHQLDGLNCIKRRAAFIGIYPTGRLRGLNELVWKVENSTWLPISTNLALAGSV